MSEEIKTEPVKSKMIEQRREAAEAMAKDLMELMFANAESEKPSLDELRTEFANKLEAMLVMGEKHGMNQAKQMLGVYSKSLKDKMTFGPANNVDKAIEWFHHWTLSSAEFVSQKQFSQLVADGHIKPVELKLSPIVDLHGGVVPMPNGRSFIGKKNGA